MVQVGKIQEKDPYVEIVEILVSYDEGCPRRTADCEECSCHLDD
jgi:hypothetical protein